MSKLIYNRTINKIVNINSFLHFSTSNNSWKIRVYNNNISIVLTNKTSILTKKEIIDGSDFIIELPRIKYDDIENIKYLIKKYNSEYIEATKTDKVLRYSERGLINSFIYELKSSNNTKEILSNFLGRIKFTDKKTNIIKIKSYSIMIEQSFSRFGDLDLLILIENEKGVKSSYFIEAKVKTYNSREWQIENQYIKFIDAIENKKLLSSNLFTQLYLKQLLVDSYKEGGIKKIKNGVKDIVGKKRKIG